MTDRLATLARLAVVASTALAFGLAWLGVVAPLPPEVTVSAPRGSRLVDAPPPRRVPVVRRSRAS